MACASRVFERPGCGALQTIPIAAPPTSITRQTPSCRCRSLVAFSSTAGKGCGYGPEGGGFTDVKTIFFQRYNKMPLGGVTTVVCTRRRHGRACHAGGPIVLIRCCRSHNIEESGFDISEPGWSVAVEGRHEPRNRSFECQGHRRSHSCAGSETKRQG